MKKERSDSSGFEIVSVGYENTEQSNDKEINTQNLNNMKPMCTKEDVTSEIMKNQFSNFVII